MKFRPARPAEIEPLAQIWHAGWHQAHPPVVPPALTARRTLAEFTQRMTQHLARVTVATQPDGTIVGFYMLKGDEVEQFYIAAPFQGQTTARMMMKHAEAALGAGVKWLACTVGNDRAAAFYTKVGWQNTGVQTYEVETASGPLDVTIWRFEKRL